MPEVPPVDLSWYRILGTLGVAGLLGTLVNAVLQIRNTRRIVELTKLSHLSTTAEEKRASIAADVLVAIMRMIDGLEAATSLGSFRIEDVPRDMPEQTRRQEEVRRDVAARQISIQPYEEEFRRAWHLAEVHLPEVVNDLFDRVHKLKVEITVAQQMHAGDLENSRLYGFFKQGYGPEPQRVLAAIRSDAKALLRPVAQIAPTA